MPAPPVRPRAGMLDRSDPARPRELPPGSVVLGRYTIQKVLGRGGMATVYLAKHQQTERLVALKLLDPEISRDPNYVERFRREARAAGRIRSEFTVAIYDLDAEVGGGLVLVMEYLEGQTVQQALRPGRLPIQKVLSFGRHMLEGLAAAHECGVIHRDLKPANLFIERSSTGTEKCKILDFGISKLADASQSELTRDGQTLGTVAYMAPEQIRGKAAPGDARVDLYSAGVTLFVMFTGKRPIDAEDPVQLLAAVLENPPLTLAQATQVPFPAPLEHFIARALAKNPQERFQTALEMRDALVQIGRSLGHEATGPLVLPGAPAPSAMTPGNGFPRADSTSGVVETHRRQTAMGMGAVPPSVPGPGPMGAPPASRNHGPSAFASTVADMSQQAAFAMGQMPPASQPMGGGGPGTGPSPAYGAMPGPQGPQSGVFGAVPPAAGGFPPSPFAMPPSPMVATSVEPTGSVPKKKGNGLVIALGAIGVMALGAAVAVFVARNGGQNVGAPPAIAAPTVPTPAVNPPVAGPPPTQAPPVSPTIATGTPMNVPPANPAAVAPPTQPAIVAPVQPVAVAPAPTVAPVAQAPVVAPAPAPVAPAPVVAPAPAPVANNPLPVAAPPPQPVAQPAPTQAPANNTNTQAANNTGSSGSSHHHSSSHDDQPVQMLPASTHGPTQTGSIRQSGSGGSGSGGSGSTAAGTTTPVRHRGGRSRGVVEDAPF